MGLYNEDITSDRITTEDVAIIRASVVHIVYLSCRAYGTNGIEADHKRAQNLQTVADKIERRLSI